VLCGAGHNLRLIIKKLRRFYATLLALLLSMSSTTALSGYAHS
jgi:IS5 family transposase